MAIHATGGCACGAIRYECSAAAAFAGNCLCRDCQQTTGSAFAPLVFVPKSAVTITGDVKYYDVKGDSAQPWDCMNPDLTTFPKMPSV